MNKEDIDISYENGELTVRGHREIEYKSEDVYGGSVFERSYGSYSRSIAMPKNIDLQHPVANFKNGVLNIKFNKSSSASDSPNTHRKILITS